MHPLTGADYVREQELNAVKDAIVAEVGDQLDALVKAEVEETLTGTIESKVDTALDALGLPILTVGATAPPTIAKGDMWLDTTNGNVLKICTDATKGSEVWTVVCFIGDVKGQVVPVGKSAPSTPAVGDIWIDTDSTPVMKFCTNATGPVWATVSTTE